MVNENLKSIIDKLISYFEKKDIRLKVEEVNKRFVIQEVSKIFNDINNHLALFNIGQLLYMDLKWYRDSLPFLEEACRLNPSEELYLQRLAEVYSYLGEKKMSRDIYQKLLILNHRNPEYWGGKAFEEFHLGDFDKAFFDFNKAIEIQPDYFANRDMNIEFYKAYEKTKKKLKYENVKFHHQLIKRKGFSMEEEISTEKKGRNKANINWGAFIVGFLFINVVVFFSAILLSSSDTELLITAFLVQPIAFFIAGMIMGYWVGVLPQFEIFGVLLGGFIGNLNKLTTGEIGSSGWLPFFISLIISIGCIFGGVKLGIKLKLGRIKNKQNVREQR